MKFPRALCPRCGLSIATTRDGLHMRNHSCAHGIYCQGERCQQCVGPSPSEQLVAAMRAKMNEVLGESR